MSPLLLALALALAAPDAGALLARPVKISADHLEVFGREHRAVYSGNARAVRDALVLTCDQLVVFYAPDESVRRIDAHGHVHAVDEQREASGDDATYDNTTGVLVATGNPEAKSAGRRVRGSKVTFTTGLDRIEVEDARSAVDDAGPHARGERLEIDADRLVLDSQKSQATWTGKVRARKATALLKSPVLVAHYDELGEVTRVVATGGVEVTDKDKWARGQRGVFDNASGLLTVTGNPEARQGKSRMKGTRVTFRSGSERLEVDDATTVIETQGKRP